MREKSGVFEPPYTWESLAEQVASPEWSPPYNWTVSWERYVPINVQKAWEAIPLEAKVTAQFLRWTLLF